MSSSRIAVLDVDGTLVDTNYQHALAWYRAFRSLGETFPIWRIHRLIGMGGDQLVALDLLDVRDLADGWTTSEDVESTKPAPDLLHVALETIGEPADAPSVVIGDSVYDVEAAKNAGMPALVVRSGGFGDDELRDAGAVGIYDTPADLTAALDETALA